MKGVDVSTPAPTSKNATRQRDDALTERQHLVLDAIRKHIAEQGFAPSFREIGEAVGLKSPSSVKHQLHALERKGYLHISANKGRAIELYDSGTDSQTATVLPGTRRPASRFSHPVTSRWSGASPPASRSPPNSTSMMSCGYRNGLRAAANCSCSKCTATR